MSWLSEVERVGAWDLEEKGEKGRKPAKIMTEGHSTEPGTMVAYAVATDVLIIGEGVRGVSSAGGL